MKYVEQKWNSYAAACVPAPPGTPQYEETRKAFYAAGVVIMSAVERTGDPEITEAAGVEFLKSIGDELRGFVSGVRQQTTQERSKNFRDHRVDPAQRRKIQIDFLRCKATGYDEESCLAVFDCFAMSKPVAVAIFRMLQAEMDNEPALQLALLAHTSMLSTIREQVRP